MITLIDYSSIGWRYWHATKDPAEAYSLIIEQLEFYSDGSAILCLEGGNLKRKELFGEYKANRPPQPAEAHDAIQAALEQAESWPMPSAKVKGYEADDVIATMCEQIIADEVRIVTNDKDLYQLIRPNVLIETTKGRVDATGCVRKFGVEPEQMRDWLALVGDASDNVPGCPHCGPGRARDLLQEFGTLNGVLDSIDKADKIRGIGKSTVNSLRDWDPTMAVKLVSLVSDLPIKIEDYLPNIFVIEEQPAH